MNKLIGYVRGIEINEHSCSLAKPNLYSKRDGEMLEICIEMDDLSEKLVDFLDEQSRPMSGNSKTNTIPFSFVSVSELINHYDSLPDNKKDEDLEFRYQLNVLIVQCESIAMLGGIESDILFLEFTVN